MYSDAAFREQSHGCLVVKYGHAAILWKSSKQNTQCTSTAESELVEVVEGLTLGDSVRVVLEELLSTRLRRQTFTDSSAALSISKGNALEVEGDEIGLGPTPLGRDVR